MVALNGSKPCGVEWKYFGGSKSGQTYNVTGTRPIDSIVVMPTRFEFDNDKDDHDFFSLKLDFVISGTAGDDTFYFTPTCYWHKSSGDGWSAPVNCMVLIKYCVPE